ncbi:MAG TPA: hypothetical protein VHO25_22750 [Polyangiaceae bacterium]|nr:hypothetical protein [Polyangiaceae bacterium]
MDRMLFGQRINRRLAVTMTLCAIIVMTAGTLAMSVAQGVLIASILLTGAFLVGVVGITYANDRVLGLGIAALLAAALPLFLGFQAIGLAILKRMGPAVAGGALVATGSLLACFATWLWVVRNSLHRSVQ